MIGNFTTFLNESHKKKKKVTINENTNRNGVSLANSMPAFKRAHFAKIWDLISQSKIFQNDEFSSKMIGNFPYHIFWTESSQKGKCTIFEREQQPQQCILSKLDAGFQTSSLLQKIWDLISQSKDLLPEFSSKMMEISPHFWTKTPQKSLVNDHSRYSFDAGFQKDLIQNDKREHFLNNRNSVSENKLDVSGCRLQTSSLLQRFEIWSANRKIFTWVFIKMIGNFTTFFERNPAKKKLP